MRTGTGTLRPVAILAIAAAAALVAGRAPAADNARAAGDTQATEATSERFAFATFRQQDDRLTVILDAYPASLRAEAAFIPVPIAIGLRGRGGPVRFHGESFSLVDAAGHEYALATYRGLMANYPQRSFDESLMKQLPIVLGGQFEGMTETSSRFFPAPGKGTRTESVELSPFTWFRDVLYFPRPADLQGVLTLKITAKGLEAPEDLNFQLPVPRKLSTD